MKNLVVHTQNKGVYIDFLDRTCAKVNERFGNGYYGMYENFDRLTIVGIPNEETKTLSIGIAFCTYPDNFSREAGIYKARRRASGGTWGKMSDYSKVKPYAIIPITEVEFSQEACLNVLYAIHDELVKLSVKEVKKLVNKQIIK